MNYRGVGSYFDLVQPKCVNKYKVQLFECSIVLHSITSYLHNIVWNTISMRNMPKLEGLGACPQEIFEISYSYIDFDGILQ